MAARKHKTTATSTWLPPNARRAPHEKGRQTRYKNDARANPKIYQEFDKQRRAHYAADRQANPKLYNQLYDTDPAYVEYYDSRNVIDRMRLQTQQELSQLDNAQQAANEAYLDQVGANSDAARTHRLRQKFIADEAANTSEAGQNFQERVSEAVRSKQEIELSAQRAAQRQAERDAARAAAQTKEATKEARRTQRLVNRHASSSQELADAARLEGAGASSDAAPQGAGMRIVNNTSDAADSIAAASKKTEKEIAKSATRGMSTWGKIGLGAAVIGTIGLISYLNSSKHGRENRENYRHR
jgi:hypothetical protein